MSSRSLPGLALAAMLTVCATAASATTPDPADPRLDLRLDLRRDSRQEARAPRPAPPAAPSSAAVADPGVGDWKAANRRVHEAGGWRALMRERKAP